MNKSYANLEELLIELDLNPRSRLQILDNAGNKIDCGYFIVTDDGHCHLFDKDGKLDDVSKVKKIYEFYIRKDIKKIIIPDNVTSIGDWTFFKCRNLVNMTIPDGVTSIGPWVFYNCTSLRSLVFKGKTMDQVKAMKNYPFRIKDESIISVE